MDQTIVGTPIQNQPVIQPKKPKSFFVTFLIVCIFAWLFAPVMIDAGSMGGVSGPIPGVFFLLPFLGQLVLLSTVINHTVLLIGSLIVFALFLTYIIRFSKTVTPSFVFRGTIVLIAYVLYWFIADAVLPVLMK